MTADSSTPPAEDDQEDLDQETDNQELDDPKLEFRYCSKCNGNYEYCQEHLFTHKHVI